KLRQWCEAHWARLDEVAQSLAASWPTPDPQLLRETLRQLPDCSELFVLDAGGQVLASSCEARRGERAICERRSEEHTSELQSREKLVCRLLLEKKKRQEPVQARLGHRRARGAG